jgi:hypothetical protein
MYPWNLPTQKAMQFKVCAGISKPIPLYSQLNSLGQRAESIYEGFPAFQRVTPSTETSVDFLILTLLSVRENFKDFCLRESFKFHILYTHLTKIFPSLQEPFLRQSSWSFVSMSRLLRCRRGLLPGADCRWVSSVDLYSGWFFSSNCNYVIFICPCVVI